MIEVSYMCACKHHSETHYDFKKFTSTLKLCIYGVFSCECKYPQSLKEGTRSSETGVTGSCEPPNVGVRSQTLVFCKSST